MFLDDIKAKYHGSYLAVRAVVPTPQFCLPGSHRSANVCPHSAQCGAECGGLM
jgi:hypothetical protein